MILPLALFVIPSLLGISIVLSTKIFQEKITILALGTISGLALFTAIAYALSIGTVLTTTTLTVLLIVFFVASCLLLYFKKNYLSWKKYQLDNTAGIFFIFFILLFSLLAPKLLIQKNDGLYTGIINAYGDVAWHTANITKFSAGQTFPPQNPIFAGNTLNYPFLANFFSSLLYSNGMSISQSLNSTALLLIPILLMLLYILIRDASGNKRVAVCAVLLFLFGGATFGFLRFPEDLGESGRGFTQFLFHLPGRDYSGVGVDEQGYHFLNPVTTLLLPQRPFLFGLPLVFAIILLIIHACNNSNLPGGARRLAFLTAGILSGILPLFHAHSVLALAPLVLLFFIFYIKKDWMYYFVPAFLIGFPEILYYLLNSSEGGSFFRYGPGWMSKNYNFIFYWIKNTGFIIPTVIFGFFIRAPKILKILAAGGAVIFIAANIWLFAPWEWDNFKLLVYWFLFSLPLVSFVAIRLIKKSIVSFKILIVLLLAMQMLSAALDIWKISLPTSSQSYEWMEWDNVKIEIAKDIQKFTQPNQIILTAPVHNSPVALSGRTQYLGYPAHIWSHGGNPWQREQAIKEFYEGKIKILPEPMPKYILVGPDEHNKYPDLKIQPEWKEVIKDRSYTLYSIKK